MDAPQQAADSAVLGVGTSGVASATRYMYACFAVVLLGLVLNLLYVCYQCPLDLSGDEAHYWDWSRHLDVSYYSKGPLVAYIIAGGRWFAGALGISASLDPAAVVRLPAVLLAALSSIGVIVLCRDIGLTWRGTLLALLICASVPMFTVGAVLMTIDAPFLCAWIWAHVFIVKTLIDHRSMGYWVAAAIIVALGILAKYTMVLIFAVIGVGVLFRSDLRKRLLTRTSIAAGLVGLAGLLPIVIWNSAHGWVSFRHVAGQAGVAQGSGFDLGGPIEFLAAQFGVSNPVWVAVLLTLLIWRKSPSVQGNNTTDRGTSFVALSTTCVFVVFLGFSFITKVQPNWPAPAILTGAILIACWAMRNDRNRQTQRRVNRIVAIGIVLGLAVSGIGRRTDLLAPICGRLASGSPPWELTPAAKYDPAARLRGWHELGAAIGDVMLEMETNGKPPILMADHYQVASEIAFYTPGQPDVYCIQSVLGDRLNQYDFWKNPIDNRSDFVGRPCVYVGTLPSESSAKGETLRAAMPGIRPVRTVEYRIGDIPFQVWTIFVADAYEGISRPASTKEISY
ncbi:MAG: glycosyltransferase family 39 protein [Phycisphaerales bacterium]|nr:glycosyltransferase family 39 protein [Phycisphaerales bacterium]MCB9863426.1 glycosyltransferase family 39 protein [Phycisphaerales bacterium]